MGRVYTLMAGPRERQGRVICERCVLADRSWLRLRGLLGRRALPAGEGVLLRPAGSVHMFFMRFAIDAVFLDREQVVVGVVPSLRPWRIAGRRGAKAVLEIAEGEAARRAIVPGERIVLVDPADAGGDHGHAH